jgi:formiminotetrahydrofolate cyclodeaminase
LEVRLEAALAGQAARQSRAKFIDALAAPLPAPGGGSASAHAGAMAAALVMMVAGLTLTKKSYAAAYPVMQAIRDEAASLKDALSAAVDEDADAYEAVMAAYKLPKESPERAPAIQRAMMGAALVPMRVAEQSARVRQLARDIWEQGMKTARTDATVAGYLAEAAMKGALDNVRENLDLIGDEAFVAEYRARVARVALSLEGS